jgi:RNA recognition motif-containing protein
MSTKIFVGNLNFQATEQDLQDLLSSYGAIQEVYMPKDRETGRPRRFAFVTFEDAAAAQAALESLKGKDLPDAPSQ